MRDERKNYFPQKTEDQGSLKDKELVALLDYK